VQEEMSLSLVVDEHRQYLSDRTRVSAFRQAVGEVVKPGDAVLDLGTGSGILGLLACRAGARRVYAIEAGEVMELARQLSCANGFQDRMVFIKGMSTRVELPERVDVMLADQIGFFGLEAGLLEYFNDAQARFLKPNGVMIPSHLELYIAPVECQELYNQVEFWNDNVDGLDFRPARSLAANTGYPAKFSPDHLLGGPALLASLDLSLATPPALHLEACVATTRGGTLHGIGGWFSAQLSKSICMSNSPLATNPINRRNLFLPIDRPSVLRKCDQIRVMIHILPSEGVMTWKLEVWGDDDNRGNQSQGLKKMRFSHSTLQGMLIPQENLRRTQPHFIPTLSPGGEAQHSVLSLCDGQRTLSEIEQEVYRRHYRLFGSLDKTEAFVAQVIARYSM
jgi:Ribosomal protein L11 methyltransferase (PrmA)